MNLFFGGYENAVVQLSQIRQSSNICRTKRFSLDFYVIFKPNSSTCVVIATTIIFSCSSIILCKLVNQKQMLKNNFPTFSSEKKQYYLFLKFHIYSSFIYSHLSSVDYQFLILSDPSDTAELRSQLGKIVHGIKMDLSLGCTLQ